jgi:hypothetical protein
MRLSGWRTGLVLSRTGHNVLVQPEKDRLEHIRMNLLSMRHAFFRNFFDGVARGGEVRLVL